jgi:hypothetical protein
MHTLEKHSAPTTVPTDHSAPTTPLVDHASERQLENYSAPTTPPVDNVSEGQLKNYYAPTTTSVDHFVTSPSEGQLEKKSAPTTQSDDYFFNPTEDQPVTAITGTEKHPEKAPTVEKSGCPSTPSSASYLISPWVSQVLVRFSPKGIGNMKFKPSTPKASDSDINISSAPSPKRQKRDKVPRKARNIIDKVGTESCMAEAVVPIPVKPDPIIVPADIGEVPIIILAADSGEDDEQAQPPPQKTTKLKNISEGVTRNDDKYQSVTREGTKLNNIKLAISSGKEGWKLSTNEEKELEALFDRKLHGEKIVAQIGKEVMKFDSFKTLHGEAWLNDEVINYCFHLLQQRNDLLHRENNTHGKTKFWTSFFFEKLLDDGKGYKYLNVKKWSKNLDIFGLSKMFFPINISNNHWALCVADMAERIITYYDSLHRDGVQYLQAMHQYIQDEFFSRKGTHLPHSDKWILKSCAQGHQNNGYDCGVFAFAYALYLSVNKEINFNQEDIVHLRKRMGLYIEKKRLY